MFVFPPVFRRRRLNSEPLKTEPGVLEERTLSFLFRCLFAVQVWVKGAELLHPPPHSLHIQAHWEKESITSLLPQHRAGFLKASITNMAPR